MGGGMSGGMSGSLRSSYGGGGNGGGGVPTSGNAFSMTSLNRQLTNEQEADEQGAGAAEVKQALSKQGLKTEYDPAAATGRPTDGARVSNNKPQRAPPPVIDTSDLRVFLMQPGPRTGPVLCHIRRSKGSSLYPKYALYLGGGMIDGDETSERFMLSARKRKKSKSANYLLSLDEEDMSRNSGNFFGKLRSNFVGTEFTIYDKGVKPTEVEAAGMGASAMRAELGAVVYQYNVLGTRGPRKMTAMIPSVDDNDHRKVIRPKGDEEGILDKHKAGDTSDLVAMSNKPPRWNEQMQAYCLNFHGRVTQASVKNFQLVADFDKEHIILQFGKVGKDTFTMDYQWPISAVQAFAICLTSFDNKLACE